MKSRSMLDEILEKVEQLPLEDQDMIVELIRNRYRQKRQDEIPTNARQTFEEYKKGLTSKGGVSDLLRYVIARSKATKQSQELRPFAASSLHSEFRLRVTLQDRIALLRPQ